MKNFSQKKAVMKQDNQETDSTQKEILPKEVTLKPHSYDGIQEYDQPLPRWWLFTLYGTVIFSAIYWLMLDIKEYQGGVHAESEAKLEAIEMLRLASSIDVTSDEYFWEIYTNPEILKAGEATYQTNCTPCHGPELKGGIGFNLVDALWVHGAAPKSIYRTIYDGVPEKGMQPWGNLLGEKKITELVAFIISKNGRKSIEASPIQ
jgi:cytochrome c oxidase cbb3-type subunit 3